MMVLPGQSDSDIGLVSDIGNVLAFNDQSRLFESIREKLGINGSSELSDERIAEVLLSSKEFLLFESGKITDMDFFNYASALLNPYGNKRLSFTAFVEAWNSPITAEGFNTEVAALYAKAIRAGHAFIQLSDTNNLHLDHAVALFPFVKNNPYVLSYFVKTTKPDPVMYGVAAGRMRMFPDKCVYVDDKAANVQGAIDAGYKAAFQYTGDNAGLERFLKEQGFRI